jgi:peptidyl-prolyl cis-trans isomerase-like 3
MAVTLHTSIGDLKLEIFCDTAPRTSFNFLALCTSGAYDGTLFHRNIKGFMMQAGDTADKTGSKGGESIWGAVPFPDEFHPSNLHDKRGVLSMANKGVYDFVRVFYFRLGRSLKNIHIVEDVCRCCELLKASLSHKSCITAGPNTNRSQFFICYERQPHLNNLHTVFGRVIDGWEILDQMERLPVLGANAPKKKLEHKPVNAPVLNKVTVHANPLADEMIVFPTPSGPPEKRA